MNRRKKQSYELAGPIAIPPTRWCYWVIQNRLLAGAYPGAPGQEEHERKIRALFNAGIRLFINLMEPDETNWEGQSFKMYDPAVQQLCPDAGCVRFPIRDQSVPPRHLMKSILDTIDRSLDAESPVYVHCWGGVGRTGIVVACWILRHGLADTVDVLDVLARLRKQDKQRGRRRSPETLEQEQFVSVWSDGWQGD